MTTAFPGSVDTLTNPTAGDTLASPSHAAQHTNANDAIEAIEGYLRATFDVRNYGAVMDGVADDTAAFTAAVAAAYAVHGTVVLPQGVLRLTAKVTIPISVSLVGQGRGTTWDKDATTILLDATGAYLDFTDPGHATIGGFTVHGNNKATKGIYASAGSKSSWRDIAVIYVPGDAFRVNYLQNAVLDNISVSYCKRGLWIDDGCGSLVVSALHCENNDEFNLKVGSSGTSTSWYTEPTAVIFIDPICEWFVENLPGTDVEACVVIEGAARAVFINGVFVAPHNPGTLAEGDRAIFKVSVVAPAVESTVSFVGPNMFYGSNQDGFWIDDTAVVDFVGAQNKLIEAITGVTFLSADARLIGDLNIVSPTDAYSFAGGADPDDVLVLGSASTVTLSEVTTQPVLDPVDAWTLAGGASDNDGYYMTLNPNGASVSQSIPVVAGAQYLVTAVNGYGDGTLTPAIGAVTGPGFVTHVGTDPSWVITAAATGSVTFSLTVSSTSTGVILGALSISVRRITGGLTTTSPNGHRWRGTMSNAGSLSWADLDA